MADYRLLELRGAPEDVGRRLARSLTRVPSAFRRNPWEDDLAFLQACAGLLRELHAPLWREIAAFAEALGLPPERGLFLRAARLPQGCSVLAWRDTDGQVFVGRNYDFYVQMPTRHLLRTATGYGYAHIGMNGGLIGGRYDGINNQGLFIGLHKVMADRAPSFEPGIPYHLLPRLALDLCATTGEAVALFRSVPHLAPFNYTIADASGDCARIECYPGLEPAIERSNRMIATTNHYSAPQLQGLIGRRPTSDSRAREESLRQAITPGQGDGWGQTAKAMSDHATPLCCHKEFGATLWSGLFELTGRRAAYAFGPPCTQPYRVIDWPEGI